MTEPRVPQQADPQEILATVGSSWAWAVGFGVATVVPGVVALVWPHETLHVLAVITGIYLMLAGLFWFVTAFGRREAGTGGRVLLMLIALAAVLAGVLCLRHPLQTIAALSLIVGAYWLLLGLMVMFWAIGGPGLRHRGLWFVVGVLGFVAGIVVLSYPVASAVAVARLLGLWLVLLGVAQLAIGVAMFAGRRVADPPPGEGEAAR
ncbi:HdeD family acid-resistance protein [Streptacidiphilus sp. EB129]|jgi:uncharacterized membrane protein HdeD (DUF308 family)|uniref:HdeD family acid-resistance protein n=1 Tax=Streptacidiphilus sp. EB129 TaxID=3156262 RepID=UPI003514328E